MQTQLAFSLVLHSVVNRASLRRLLLSIREQSFDWPRLEILVPADLQDIAKEDVAWFGLRGARVRLLRTGPNPPHHEVMNAGLLEATSDLVYFRTARYRSVGFGSIGRLLQAAYANPKADVLVGKIYMAFPLQRIVGIQRIRLKGAGPSSFTADSLMVRRQRLPSGVRFGEASSRSKSEASFFRELKAGDVHIRWESGLDLVMDLRIASPSKNPPRVERDLWLHT